MAAGSVLCPKCRGPLVDGPAATIGLDHCPACRTRLWVVAFPALNRPARSGSAAEAVIAEGEAACFYHAAKKAAVPCDECGRFLCALCDLEVGGRHLCPVCLESGSKTGRVDVLERSRVRHDQIVWYLLLLPLLTCGFVLPLTAPIALVWTLVRWKAKPSLVDRTRLRLAWAIPVAVIEVGLGVGFWIGMFSPAMFR